MSFRIHLVEDEHHLNAVLSSYLKKEGWEVSSFFDGNSAIKSIPEKPHLWILDIMLPDVDGYQLIKKIKKYDPSTPVIFISARDADLDKILGLELGSDDYLAKPFLPKELVIRCRKLLERVYPDVQNKVTYGFYSIDEEKRLVFKEDEPITLTSKEFDLFYLLVKNIGRAFSREEILTIVWGEDFFGSDRVVDDLVRRLRKKMPMIKLETVYGYGYRMVESI
ncbi:response regulator transcription factor [Bacillus sp. FJAT-47783]|uniref:response regulator transcription factor n=1 Tax=Bacillus sp. FJAT-47783 TaxID=2922712 RepID=UPI001FAC8524|nr:response regulator transcription factor [Bacillus sp. FJAT-47783]